MIIRIDFQASSHCETIVVVLSITSSTFDSILLNLLLPASIDQLDLAVNHIENLRVYHVNDVFEDLDDLPVPV